jgi:transcriptional regulator with XRE-family HTH domain
VIDTLASPVAENGNTLQHEWEAMRKRPLAEQDAHQLRELGVIIRASRRGMLSLEALAKRAGISVGQVSRIENGTGNPSLEILLRIAEALGLNLTDLIEPPPAIRTVVVRSGQGRAYRSPANPSELELIIPALRHEISVTHGVAQPGVSRRSEHPISGVVMYYILSGTVTIEKGGESFPLDTGDSLLVSFPHSVTVTSDTPAEHLTFFRPDKD